MKQNERSSDAAHVFKAFPSDSMSNALRFEKCRFALCMGFPKEQMTRNWKTRGNGLCLFEQKHNQNLSVCVYDK